MPMGCHCIRAAHHLVLNKDNAASSAAKGFLDLAEVHIAGHLHFLRNGETDQKTCSRQLQMASAGRTGCAGCITRKHD